MRTASHAILYTNFVSRASIFALPHAVASARAKAAPTTHFVPSRESPASTRLPRSRAPCPCSAHYANLRLPRIGFCAATQSASVRAKTTSTTLTVISRIHSTATVAHRVLARRIVLHANLRLPRVGLRAATRCRQCARIRRRKEARRASVRAKTTSTTRPAPSR